jgi:signal transduction histidine kinase
MGSTEHSNPKLFQLLRSQLALAEQYRQSVAFEIHDAIAQPLSAAVMEFSACEPCADCRQRPQFAKVLALLCNCLSESRRVMEGLRPALLEEHGLVAAVGHLVEQTQVAHGVPIEWIADSHVPRLAPAAEAHLFRILQEGLLNAVRHSRSDRIRLGLRHEGDRLCAEVEDWGIGFVPGRVAPGRMGLQSISQRTKLLGGRLQINSAANDGTRVSLEVPCAGLLAGG